MLRGFSSMKPSCIKRFRKATLAVFAFVTTTSGVGAQQIAPDGVYRLPFTATLSNLTPLAFGMDVGETSHALGQPLHYVGGPPSNETYLVLRDLGGSGLIEHRNRLFLKFRRGRLTGWKEDYGENWMWQ
jgi:hypothetical protein